MSNEAREGQERDETGRPDAYNAEAASDAWKRTLNFFRERLGS